VKKIAKTGTREIQWLRIHKRGGLLTQRWGEKEGKLRQLGQRRKGTGYRGKAVREEEKVGDD